MSGAPTNGGKAAGRARVLAMAVARDAGHLEGLFDFIAAHGGGTIGEMDSMEVDYRRRASRFLGEIQQNMTDLQATLTGLRRQMEAWKS